MKILILVCLISVACILGGCKTKQKAISKEKTEVTRESVIDRSATETTTDKSVTTTTAETVTGSEYQEETTIHADSIKIDASGKVTYYTGSKPVTTKRTGMATASTKMTATELKDLVKEWAEQSNSTVKLDSVGKTKSEVKEVDSQATGKTWGIALSVVIGVVAISALYLMLKEIK